MTRKARIYDNHPMLDIDFRNDDGLPSDDSVEATVTSTDDEPDLKPEVTELTPYQRLITVRNQAGFFPHSARELDLALGSIENAESLKGGFGRYLNEVLIHQRKSVSDDPKAAVRKIVTEISGFAYDSRASVAMIDELRKELPDGQFSTIGSSSRLEDWRLQETTRRGLGLLARRDRLINMSRDDRPDFAVSDEDIKGLVGTMRRYEATASIDGIDTEEASRFMFWTDTLRSSRSHMVADPLAKSALSKLGL